MTADPDAPLDAALDAVTLRDVRRLRLQPGDTLVVRPASLLPLATVQALHGRLREMFPGNQVLILGPGDDLSVVERRAVEI